MTRLGCVPFVNALPLVALFEDRPELGIEVVYDQPSRLPRLLDAGEADAILVSSWYRLANPGLRAVEGVCIGSQGAVESVRLFSKVRFEEVRSLALDQSSMTSNALALAVLKKRFGTEPVAEACPPDLETMLAVHDAALLIGDAGMAADGAGLHVLDLGAAWVEWKGLPFVWALWVGRDCMDERLAARLLEARDYTGLGSDGDGPTAAGHRVLQRAVDQAGPAARAYLQQSVSYRVGPKELAALDEFAREAGLEGFPRHDSVIGHHDASRAAAWVGPAGGANADEGAQRDPSQSRA